MDLSHIETREIDATRLKFQKEKVRCPEANGLVEGWDVQLPGMLRLKPQEPFEGGKFCMGLVWIVSGKQQQVHKVWLRTDRLSIKCHVYCRWWLEISLFGPDFGSKTACLCTVGPIGDFAFSVSNS